MVFVLFWLPLSKFDMNPVIRERFKGLERALKLQAREYERRLDGLNHEAQRVLESQQKSISVEKFDGVVGQIHSKMDSYHKSNDDKVAELSKRVYYITGGIIVLEVLLRYILKI